MQIATLHIKASEEEKEIETTYKSVLKCILSERKSLLPLYIWEIKYLSTKVSLISKNYIKKP